jgi:hypothetical protein
VHVNDLDVLELRGAPAQRVEEDGRGRSRTVHEDLLTGLDERNGLIGADDSHEAECRRRARFREGRLGRLSDERRIRA